MQDKGTSHDLLNKIERMHVEIGKTLRSITILLISDFV